MDLLVYIVLIFHPHWMGFFLKFHPHWMGFFLKFHPHWMGFFLKFHPHWMGFFLKFHPHWMGRISISYLYSILIAMSEIVQKQCIQRLSNRLFEFIEAI